MPKALQYLALLVPSSSAINGIVSVSQLGAPLSDVRTPFLTLWALALFYGCLAVGLEVRMRRSHH
jgi:ABC-2 type transport system permease protein